MHIEGPGLTIIEGQQCVRIVWYPSTIKFTHSLNVQSEKLILRELYLAIRCLDYIV